jgi:ATP-dependent RNA circularization protein (DNA/RNA ligase family)
MLQGEHTGGKIQQNIYKLPEHHMYLFRIWDIDTKRYYVYDEFMEFCHKYSFEHVPTVSEKMALLPTVQEMLDFSNRTDELVPGVKVKSEGLVWTRKDRMDISFKVKSPEYLILHGK